MKLVRILPFLLATLPSFAGEPCRIEITEKGSGWPVPLVELRTTHNMRFVTDNAGVIAFDAPELMGRETFFNVIGHGYEVKADGFGIRGVRLTPKPGETLKVEVERRNIAKRLGRLTGSGLFAESEKTGRAESGFESGALGCDSVQNAVHRGKLHWLWGDTVMSHYPLGVFDMTGAVTPVRPLASFEPPLRLTFDYFRDGDGRPRGLAKMPGAGPTWLGGMVSLPDKNGAPRLVASYVKIRNHLEAYESGLCVWNEETSAFDRHRVLWSKTDAAPKMPPMPDGHSASLKDEGGREWMYFGNPLPNLRFPAVFESWEDPKAWEILTPQESLKDASGGPPVKPHTGHIAWNDFRRRWVTVFLQAFGKPSVFGELWYAEAKSPTGPWGPAVKILTHENHTFYNPKLHPAFPPDGASFLIFEGTYTREFADHAEATPRHDYNQFLYRLDLDDPALAPAKVE